MPAVLVMPLAERCRAVDPFNSLPPAGRIVCTETDLSFLRCNYRCARLDRAQIKVEDILKPHARDDEQPPLGGFIRSFSPPLDGTVHARDKLLQQLVQIPARKVCWRSCGVKPNVDSSLHRRHQLETIGKLIDDASHVAKESFDIEKTSKGCHRSCLGVNDQWAPDSAARCRCANHGRLVSPETICQVAEHGYGTSWKPVAQWLPIPSDLRGKIVRQMR